MLWSQSHKGPVPSSPVLMPNSLWQVLYARGFQDKNSIENFYSPKLKDLRDPFSINGMAQAVPRILKAINENEKIAVYADYDLDGSPGGVLLKRGLEQLGAIDVELRQPKRLTDGYGFHKHIIDEFHKDGRTLIVTVDVGITDLEAAKYCKELGIDLIVTDHHLPKDQLPEAIAVVNPNSGICDSGLGHLSGTGVAFYLLMALKTQSEKDINLKDFLDLFALATITDMVPLVDENRSLIKHGLKVLQNTKWPGLRSLLDQLGFNNKQILSTDIGFRIAPKLNALSRLEEDLFPADILLANADEAESVSKRALSLNDKRKDLQEKVFADALEKINFQFAKGKSKSFVFVSAEDYHPGVISVVANKIMDKFSCPVFIASQKQAGSYVGSARSPFESINLQDVLGATSEHLEKFGGHKLAAGFEIQSDKIESFKEALDEYFAKTIKQSHSAQDEIQYDAQIDLQDLNEGFMRWYLGMEPFGVGFEDPLFLMSELKIKNIKELKKPHLKLTLESSGQAIEALWFSAPEDYGYQEGQHVDVLGRPSWNEWNGRKRIQWLISNIRPS